MLVLVRVCLARLGLVGYVFLNGIKALTAGAKTPQSHKDERTFRVPTVEAKYK